MSELVTMRASPSRQHVLEIVLTNEGSLNALSSRTSTALARAARAADDQDVRAVVLMSEVPRAFAAGADLTERLDADERGLLAIRAASQEATSALLAIPVPVVAAVHGFVLGGGLELALAADIIVADEGAVLGLPETAIGIVPGGGGTSLLLERVGYGTACDLVLSGRRLTAAEAHSLGLVDRLVSEGTAVEHARSVAESISERAPGAVRLAKASLRSALRRAPAAALSREDRYWREAALSPEYREGLAAFAAKRAPRWA